MIDTHAHIYSEEFDSDREEVIKRAREAGLSHVVLANVDMESFPQMMAVWKRDPEFFVPTIGLHPTSVKENYAEELDQMDALLKEHDFKAIGEIGLDLYWDDTYLKEQLIAFERQVRWAAERNLPVIIHVRNAFTELHDALDKLKGLHLRGIIHSFSGDVEDVRKIKQAGDFLFGINGIVTFKKSTLPEVVREIGLEHLVVETDAPYLAPVPFRGKRNEPAYVVKTAEKISDIFETSIENVDQITTSNAERVFNLTKSNSI